MPQPPTMCPDCREPVEWKPLPTDPPFNGRSSPGWKHVRTGAVACDPLCAVCHAEHAERRHQKQEYDGSWTVVASVCSACHAHWRRTQSWPEQKKGAA